MLSIRRLTLLSLTVAIAIGSVAFVACGGGTSSSKTSGSGSQVKVELKEWSLTPDKTSAPAGKVTFTATNAGTVEHEFVVIKTDKAADALTLSGNAVDEEASGQSKVDEIAEFQPGSAKTLTLDLQPGKYVLICNVAGHYRQGVSSAFTVTASTSGQRY